MFYISIANFLLDRKLHFLSSKKLKNIMLAYIYIYAHITGVSTKQKTMSVFKIIPVELCARIMLFLSNDVQQSIQKTSSDVFKGVMMARSLVKCAISKVHVHKIHSFRCDSCRGVCRNNFKRESCGPKCDTNICIRCKPQQQEKCCCGHTVCSGCIKRCFNVHYNHSLSNYMRCMGRYGMGCREGCVNCMVKCHEKHYFCYKHQPTQCLCGKLCCVRCRSYIHYENGIVKCDTCADVCFVCNLSIKKARISSVYDAEKKVSSWSSVCSFGDWFTDNEPCPGEGCDGCCGEFVNHTGDENIQYNWCENKKNRVCDPCRLAHMCCGKVNVPKDTCDEHDEYDEYEDEYDEYDESEGEYDESESEYEEDETDDEEEGEEENDTDDEEEGEEEDDKDEYELVVVSAPKQNKRMVKLSKGQRKHLRGLY